VKAWQGQGADGAVYRAVRVGFRRSEPGALKVSLLRWNWRMEREVEPLSRLSHPGIPRLLERGGPWPPSGKEYPFFVMEWVQGPALYAWAEQHAPTGKQVCRVLAQLARALEAVHAAGAVHRDVKGANVLVRLEPWLALAAAGACAVLLAVLLWHSEPVPTPPGVMFVSTPRLQTRRRQTRARRLRETPRPASLRHPPRLPWRSSPWPRSPFPSPVQVRPGLTRKASVRDAGRCPSTEAAGWSCSRRLPRSACRSAACFSKASATPLSSSPPGSLRPPRARWKLAEQCLTPSLCAHGAPAHRPRRWTNRPCMETGQRVPRVFPRLRPVKWGFHL
jgi:serine/threonine protein kinase